MTGYRIVSGKGFPGIWCMGKDVRELKMLERVFLSISLGWIRKVAGRGVFLGKYKGI